jgi:hypothetical protein
MARVQKQREGQKRRGAGDEVEEREKVGAGVGFNSGLPPLGARRSRRRHAYGGARRLPELEERDEVAYRLKEGKEKDMGILVIKVFQTRQKGM